MKPKRYLNPKIKIKLDNGWRVVHFHNIAYCVAKPEVYCAVIVIPPQTNRFTNQPYEASFIIQGKSAAFLNAGDWCAAAYVSNAFCGHEIAIQLKNEKL